MAAHDRIERFAKIRARLGDPLPQKPDPDTQLHQMLKDEQELNLRLSNSHQAWGLMSSSFNTVVGTTEYNLVVDAKNQLPGKVYFVIRTTSDENLPYISIPFDDFNSLDYGKMPTGVNRALLAPEKISFYRSDFQDQIRKAVLQPTPQEVLTYTVWTYIGSLDRSKAAFDKVGPVTELVDWLDLKSSRALISRCEWRLDDDAYNDRQEKKYRESIDWELAQLAPIVGDYIKQLNAPKSFDMGFALDED